MYRAVLPYPVVAGKGEADVRRVAELLSSRPDEYWESRRRGAVTLERAYFQATPMGDVLVAYLEGERPIGEAFAALATSDLPIDHEFARLVKEVHGVDVTQPPPGPPPETVGEWVDEQAGDRGRGMAFCAPLLPDRVDAGRDWAREAFVARRDEFAASRRDLGETAEVVTVTQTPNGPICCVYLEGADPAEANRRFAASTSAYDTWFKEQLATIFPPQIDFSQPVPPVTETFDSEKLAVAR